LSADDDKEPVDRPAELPEQQSAVDPAEAERRETKKQHADRLRREWLIEQLRNPVGREFLWGILFAAGTFEEKYGFGPNGEPNDRASEYFLGQKDLGLRLYHSWSVLDRAGVLSLLDEFHPVFPKPRKGK
jgi:hypothetical protein